MRQKPHFPLQKLTMLSLLTAVSLMIYGLESLLPPPVPVPGIKLGLANVITLITLSRYGMRESGMVLACRILLATIFFGQAVSLSYSLAGGVLCLLTMSLIQMLLQRKYLVLTSIMGAISHNVAQLFVAFFITQVHAVFGYLPFLLISAVLTGAFTGFCAQFSLRCIPNQIR